MPVAMPSGLRGHDSFVPTPQTCDQLASLASRKYKTHDDVLCRTPIARRLWDSCGQQPPRVTARWPSCVSYVSEITFNLRRCTSGSVRLPSVIPRNRRAKAAHRWGHGVSLACRLGFFSKKKRDAGPVAVCVALMDERVLVAMEEEF